MSLSSKLAINRGSSPLTQTRQIRFNRGASAPLRRATLEGEEHVVAPVVAAIEGVLNGVFVSAEELGRYVQAWNGIPIPILHPESSGQHISANSPQVIEQQTVGRFFNARMDGPKLKGEVWINVRKAQQVAPGLIEAMENGEMFEVSTAYFSDMIEANGTYNGREYRGAHVHLRPDHLALLPGEVGACSIADGCGCPRLNHQEANMHVNILSRARSAGDVSYEGTEETDWGEVDLSLEAFVAGYYAANPDAEQPDEQPGTVEALPAAAKSWIAERTLLGDPEAEEVDGLIALPIVNPSTNRLNERGLRAVLSRAPQMDGVTDEQVESAQNTARELLNQEFDADLETNVDERGLFRRFVSWMRAESDSKPDTNTNEETAVKVNAEKFLAGVTAFVNKALEGLKTNVSVTQLSTMLNEAVNQRFRQNPMQNIFIEDILLDEQAAIVRMDKYGGSIDEDPWTLMKVPYTVSGESVALGEGAIEVVQATEYREVGAAASEDDGPTTQSSKRGGDQPGASSNDSNKEITMNREAVIKGLIAHTKAPFTDADQDYLTALTDERLEDFAKSFECDCQTGEPIEANTDKSGNEPGPASAVRANTAEEFIEQAPAEMQDMLKDGLKLHRERRTQLIEGIKANAANPYSDEELRAMSNEGLEKVSRLASAGGAVDYSGRGGPRDTVQANADDENVAPAPLKVSDRLNANKQAAS